MVNCEFNLAFLLDVFECEVFIPFRSLATLTLSTLLVVAHLQLDMHIHRENLSPANMNVSFNYSYLKLVSFMFLGPFALILLLAAILVSHQDF